MKPRFYKRDPTFYCDHTVLWTKQAILSIGISQAEPTFPGKPQLFTKVLRPAPDGLPQAFPTAQPGAGPMLVMSLTKQGFTSRITPVKPQPDCPPLVVKMVTVSPIKSCKWSTKLPL